MLLKTIPTAKLFNKMLKDVLKRVQIFSKNLNCQKYSNKSKTNVDLDKIVCKISKYWPDDDLQKTLSNKKYFTVLI